MKRDELKSSKMVEMQTEMINQSWRTPNHSTMLLTKEKLLS